MTYQHIACVADKTEKAQEALAALKKKCPLVPLSKADVVVVLGGDGFMLHTLHAHINLNKPFYGMNCGTVGFLLNEFSTRSLLPRLKKAKAATLHPLRMKATSQKGKVHTALAINEVSLLRETRQAAHVRVSIDEKVRIPELVCDGILVATPAGSTAYNLSVHGPIIPVHADLLALTPISPFRPRRWRGALLPHKARVMFEVVEDHKRPVSAVADFTEIRDVKKVEIAEDRSITLTLLFDPGHSLEERIVGEQFLA